MASEAADSADWYTTTGEALITTIAINVMAPRMPDLVEYIFAGPWRRRKESSAAAVTQKQLNNSWKGGCTFCVCVCVCVYRAVAEGTVNSCDVMSTRRIFVREIII